MMIDVINKRYSVYKVKIKYCYKLTVIEYIIKSSISLLSLVFKILIQCTFCTQYTLRYLLPNICIIK